MDPSMKTRMAASIEEFRLPTYSEIPDVGLYLEQTAKYITDYLSPLQGGPITGSMISNYVKKGLISSPVRKQYSREQIAKLIFIAVAKSVMSMDDLRLMMRIQEKTYPSQIAYDYFRTELDNMLGYVFGRKNELETIGVHVTDEKVMLRNMIITVAHKVYLDKLLATLRGENGESVSSGKS